MPLLLSMTTIQQNCIGKKKNGAHFEQHEIKLYSTHKCMQTRPRFAYPIFTRYSKHPVDL